MTNKEKFLELVVEDQSGTMDKVRLRIANREKIRNENREKLREIRDRETDTSNNKHIAK